MKPKQTRREWIAGGPWGDHFDGVRPPLRDWVDPTRANRTRQESPYTYTEFYHWRNENERQKSSAVYSDRMFQWNAERVREADKKFCARFELMSPEELTQYMSFYFGKPVKATALAEGCNPSNGYPYYIVWYREQAASDEVGGQVFSRNREKEPLTPSKPERRKAK